MKKTILFFAAFAAIVSCAKDNLPDNTQSAESFAITLQATAPSTSGDDTKTTLVPGENNTQLVHWTKGDAIKVGFFASTAKAEQILNKSGMFVSTFENETSSTARFRIEDWNWHYNTSDGGRYDAAAYTGTGIALYPSTVSFSSIRQNATTSVETTIQYNLTSEQTAVEDSFMSELCFSYADVNKEDFMNNSAELKFKNACALIKVVLPAEASDVKSVKVESLSGIPLAGTFQHATITGAAVDFEIVYGSTEVVLTAQDEETLTAGGSYYIVVCPGTHSDGLVFTFTNTEGKTCRKTLQDVYLFEKAKIDEFKFKTVTYEEEIDYSKANVGDYFYSDGSFSTAYDDTKASMLVGVVFYKGDPTKPDATLAADHSGCTHGLVVGINENYQPNYIFTNTSSWNSYTQNGISIIGVNYTKRVEPAASTMTGYNNTQAVRTADANSNAIKYLNGKTPVNGVSPWYYPSIAECDEISEIRSTVLDQKLTAANKNTLPSGRCLTVCEESGTYFGIYNLSTKGLSAENKNNQYTNNPVTLLPIFAF